MIYFIAIYLSIGLFISIGALFVSSKESHSFGSALATAVMFYITVALWPLILFIAIMASRKK